MAFQKNFVVKNGIEVNDNLIFANTDSNKVGIATTTALYNLHVNGGIGVTDSIVSGVSTVNTLIISGGVGIGNSFGTSGQYLVSTGTGVTWSSVPTVRSTDLSVATVGQTTFSLTYTVGLLDVFVNGVKLSSDEYTATNGSTVILNDACFGGETVEFVSYSPFGIGVGGVPTYWESTVAGIHTLSNVGVGTTNPTSALTVKGNTSLEALSVSGVSTSQGGFTSGIGVTDPVQITVSGNVLTFNVVGVGSTSLTLY